MAWLANDVLQNRPWGILWRADGCCRVDQGETSQDWDIIIRNVPWGSPWLVLVAWCTFQMRGGIGVVESQVQVIPGIYVHVGR